MLSVLRGTDETLEIEDVLNSESLFLNLCYFIDSCGNVYISKDQREFGEHNIDPHALFNAK